MVISEYIYCIVCKQFDIGVDLARDVVNVDEEQLFLVVLVRKLLPSLIFLLKLGHTHLVPIYQKVFDTSVSFSADTIIV